MEELGKEIQASGLKFDAWYEANEERGHPLFRKDIMLMKYFRELSDAEIAEEMGVKEVSVRVHLSRARKHLAQVLQERGIGL